MRTLQNKAHEDSTKSELTSRLEIRATTYVSFF